MTISKTVAMAAAGLAAGFIFLGTAAAADMPPLPDAIKQKGKLHVGIKCDYPPDGFLDESGKPVGLEVSLAKQIAEYAFGDAENSELMCVTSANRVPALLGGKVDMLVATLGISEDRKKVIDFSDPYTWSASSLLVAKDSNVQSIADLKGKTVVVLKGAWQIPWFEETHPEITLMKLDTVSDALQALAQGRAQAYAHDLAVQIGIAQNNKSVRLLDDRYMIGYRGIGLRKNEEEWRNYVNAALKRILEEKKIPDWVRQYEEPDLVEARIEMWDPSRAPEEK